MQRTEALALSLFEDLTDYLDASALDCLDR